MCRPMYVCIYTIIYNHLITNMQYFVCLNLEVH